MFIAQELRKSSIAEYLLYMWQVEDIIRAYDCSLTRLRKEYISNFQLSEEQMDEEIDWWGNLINKIVVQSLAELHAQLLQSPKFPFYSAEYYKVLPFIVELRNRGDKDINEIETCLNALYGVMMLRLQQKEITPSTQNAIKEITTFIGMLSDYYHKDKTEGINFDED